MKFFKQGAVVLCLGIFLAVFSTGALALSPAGKTVAGKTVDGTANVADQGSESTLFSSDSVAPALAAVALIGLVGIARRRHPS